MLQIVDVVDTKKWREFVQNHPQGNVFQTPEMAEVFERASGYSSFFRAWVEDRVLKGVLLSSIIGERGLISSFSTRSVVVGGPLFSSDVDFEDKVRFLRACEVGLSGLALFTQIRPVSDSSDAVVFKSAGYSAEERLNFLIDLQRPVEELWASIPKSRRKNIKRAERLGVEVEELTSKSMMPVFYGFIVDTYRRVRLPVADGSLFEAAFDVLRPVGMARFYIARYKGEPIASRVVLTYKGVVYDWYAGSSNEHMNLYANEALVWRVLKDAAEDGFHTFNFGGAGRPGENAGRYVFKKRFGATEVRQGRYVKVHSPIKMKVAGAGFKFYQTLKW